MLPEKIDSLADDVKSVVLELLRQNSGLTARVDELVAQTHDNYFVRWMLNKWRGLLAIAYCKQNGLAYRVFEPYPPKRIVQGYADNFAYKAREPWTH